MRKLLFAFVAATSGACALYAVSLVIECAMLRRLAVPPPPDACPRVPPEVRREGPYRGPAARTFKVTADEMAWAIVEFAARRDGGTVPRGPYEMCTTIDGARVDHVVVTVRGES